jgi:thiamine pyrophosphate-dependent acetolactate synthase large subunit-like protein
VVDLFYGEKFLLPDGTLGNPMLFVPDIRYDKLFQSLGCYVERVEEPGEIKPALYRSFASGKTAVIDVVVDRKVYHPMLQGN